MRYYKFILTLLIALLASSTVYAAYIVHTVSGNVTIITDGKATPLTKGTKLSPSDQIEIPKDGKVEILNDLDNQIYTSTEPGRISVMRLMVNAKQKAADNSGSVIGQLALGKKSGNTDGRIYVEKGMVKREMEVIEGAANAPRAGSLASKLYAIADKVPGMVGIAVVSAHDTVTVNNAVHYPMMSVFKLHQSLAAAEAVYRMGSDLDSALYIIPSELDPDTWSPMVKELGLGDYSLSVGELMKYAITSSDNNASNILFRFIANPAATDAFVKSIAPDPSFNISFSEAEMKADPALSYANYTTPLSAARLIHKVFTQPGIIPRAAQDSICTYLTEVTTGQDRLGAAIEGKPGVVFGHKTGSGYRNPQGELIAHNDVGYFRLPDGREYSLAVFIRDFDGPETEASAIIALISQLVYSHFSSSR